MGAYSRVKTARLLNRPSADDFIEFIFDSYIELHGDRLYRDDKAVIGGIAMLGDMPVTVVGIQKGKTTEENIQRNFGMPFPEGYRKAQRLMKQAEKFNRPVVTFINTPGAYCGIEAEERGQGEAIAKSLMVMSALTVPIVSFIIGEGGSGGALALAVANKVFMLQNAVYSILSPEGFASILWKNPANASKAAELMRLTAGELLEMKVIDGIIDEPRGGAHVSFPECAELVKTTLIEELSQLSSLSREELVSQRYERFRAF